jgi:hypothetical protein
MEKTIEYENKEWEYKFPHKRGFVYANGGERIFMVDGEVKLKYRFSLDD